MSHLIQTCHAEPAINMNVGGAVLAAEAQQDASLSASQANLPTQAIIVGDIQAAIEANTPVDCAPSAPPNDDEVIAMLAALSLLDYDRVRVEKAKEMGVQTRTLDAYVKMARNTEIVSRRTPFVEVEPHPEPVDPAQLLNDLFEIIRQHVVMSDDQAYAAALWVALTYFVDVVDFAPLLIINAPDKACGKTVLLNLLGWMSYRPFTASNASVSSLFRAVEAWTPTIFVDEADTFFGSDKALHGMFNAGHVRGSYVTRTEHVNGSLEPVQYSVYGPKAIAGISLGKHLPSATMSRGIVINLRRKLPHETVSRLRQADKRSFSVIASKLARFAADYSDQVISARMVLPEALSDRDQDNWDGLLAVASCAGEEWVERATAAALMLSGADSRSLSVGNELLADIQRIFATKNVAKISGADLYTALCDDEEGAWATYTNGRPITRRQLAQQLAAYGIESKAIRHGIRIYRGYERTQFEDAFARYVSAPPVVPVTALQPNIDWVSNVTGDGAGSAVATASVTQKSQQTLACNTVTDKSLAPDSGHAQRKMFDHRSQLPK